MHRCEYSTAIIGRGEVREGHVAGGERLHSKKSLVEDTSSKQYDQKYGIRSVPHRPTSSPRIALAR